jgi:hypothetical protein
MVQTNNTQIPEILHLHPGMCSCNTLAYTIAQCSIVEESSENRKLAVLACTYQGARGVTCRKGFALERTGEVLSL